MKKTARLPMWTCEYCKSEAERNFYFRSVFSCPASHENMIRNHLLDRHSEIYRSTVDKVAAKLSGEEDNGCFPDDSLFGRIRVAWNFGVPKPSYHGQIVNFGPVLPVNAQTPSWAVHTSDASDELVEPFPWPIPKPQP